MSVLEQADEFLEVLGQGGFDAKGLPGPGMVKAKRLGVQRLAVEGDRERRNVAGTIDRLANDRVADFGQMDANLVSSPGLEPTGKPGGEPPVGVDCFVVGDGGDPLAGPSRDAAAAVAAIGDQAKVDRAGRRRDPPLDNRQVEPFDRVLAKDRLKRAQCARPRDDQNHPGGPLIQPMHDPHIGSFPAPNTP